MAERVVRLWGGGIDLWCERMDCSWKGETGGGLVSQGVAGKGAGMVWIFLQNSKRRRKKIKS
jgi:hypothetical protein